MRLSEPRESKVDSPSIPGVITTAITVAGFAFLYLTQRQSLSPFEQLVFGLIIAVSILLFLNWIWYRPIAHYWTERSFDRREDRISREGLVNFESFVDRLKSICSPQRMDSIVYSLNSLK